MNVSDLMEAMSKAGAPLDAILIAVRAIEAKDAEIEARRANDRDRKRRQRGTVTGQSRDMSGTVAEAPPALDKEIPPTPPKEINPSPRVSATPARATRILPDWVPAKPLPPDVAELVAQWPPGRLERELPGFRDYWVARTKDAARTDWDRVWWNRIRDQHDRVLRDSQNGRHQSNIQPRGNTLRGQRPDPALDLLRAAQAAQRIPDRGGDHREARVALPPF